MEFDIDDKHISKDIAGEFSLLAESKYACLKNLLLKY